MHQLRIDPNYNLNKNAFFGLFSVADVCWSHVPAVDFNTVVDASQIYAVCLFG